jgi:ferredoxin
VTVRTGGESLNARTAAESETLAVLGAGAKDRLACQCVVDEDLELE